MTESYTFKTQSKAGIDLSQIAWELNHNHPVAVVKVQPDSGSIQELLIVQDHLAKKAKSLRMGAGYTSGYAEIEAPCVYGRAYLLLGITAEEALEEYSTIKTHSWGCRRNPCNVRVVVHSL